ncbi:50S ribosomal protein L33 [Candidatus Daviesbacteria bacterium RIFCSPHIGHO2_01_FULL_44_29]|uniref:Large ribosomal subunit protein bL33 n=1 Tax=Candidatus Daviesbacteria bacterium RIFCSPHIGHO2_02_FULL_43_12 TaxID=1797776 RepID=A0A1F5KL68_9BACT|nr:MAG: 50S ribosomal protein L33 [Candidatus Daviesbacteria bacterium RIFCSPHIGHO2_01_FULL_44_29]OGE39677.1 MAG: 50S ribosomal protein L33 [Candidatus Daviesbacteria bacterium RIFCSPHIGHO2_12_FULL_47_45]OGE41535.1 MAG: 50S ribosomal protein L33 [Candidatus Daviesbacteria bacterium RIFCSPHIGHO2_02_FULL_43_12]OGE69817.1 MAG: 50S ribosomal protein L33 [Candidatus Daviesbacteria bacterium RIFCSPLOWO2_01_FULL_43_15]
MAKNNRSIFGLECSICKSRNYVSQKNSVNTKDKLTLNKYCRKCRKATPHDEFKKLG